MKRNLPFILAGVLLFLGFVFFSFFVHKDLFTQLDFDTTVGIQDKISRRFDTFFSLLSLIGSFEIVSIILLTIGVILRKLRIIFVLLFFGLIHGFEFFGKAFVTHPGPPFLFSRYDIGFVFPTSYIQPGSSYPSGHLARTLFVSLIISFLTFKAKKLSQNQKYLIYILIFIFNILMFVSRIYLGEHWLSDVIGGSILGASFAVFSLALF